MYVEREGAVNLGLLPFYHIYAVLVTFLSSLSWGQTTVVIPGFDPRLFLEIVPKYKVRSCLRYCAAVQSLTKRSVPKKKELC